MLMRRPEQADAANRRITGALGIQEARQDPGDEDDGDTEQDPENGRVRVEFPVGRSV